MSEKIVITTLAERPELFDPLAEFKGGWPVFMQQDPVGGALMGRVRELFPEHVLLATEGDELVAIGRSIPFVFPDEDRTELPTSGWDRALIWGAADHRKGRTPTVASALEISVRASHLGQGLSHTMLATMRANVRSMGLKTLYAPVRPNGKQDPRQPMAEYLEQVRDDGLPVDPWLRVHVKAGGKILRTAETSMVMAGSLAEWREWTGLPFDRTGEVIVPKALVPVHCDLDHNYAVYVEPNVWVRHDL
ncbi:N-acetyltransferase [Kribbella sp. NBC_00382]|uniref:N-acetyltransferase n=1 Tax=Kribbella sp. NBC_00382 TaxID=2975967 RepID=UPI002E21AD66